MQLKPVMQKTTVLGFGLTTIATLILAGCGGGGGTAGGAPNSTAGATATVTGVAAAGLISNARVSIYKSTDTVTPLKTMDTGANGVYSFDVPTNTGAVIIKVAPIAGISKMYDERTGQQFDFTKPIRTALPVLVAGTNQAHATPFTEAMVKSIETDPTPAKMALAKQGVMIITGTDPVVTPPVHVAKASAADRAKTAIMADKLARMNDAAEKDATCGTTANATAVLGDRLDCLAAKIGTAMVTSATTITPNSAILGPILTNLQTAALPAQLFVKEVEMNATTAVAPVDAPALSATEQAQVAASVVQLANVTTQANSVAGLTPMTATALTGVATAKAFFKDLRTSLNLYSNTAKTGLLDMQRTRISNNMIGVVGPDVQAMQEVARAISSGQQLYQEVVNGTWQSNPNNQLQVMDMGTQVRVKQTTTIWYGPFAQTQFVCKTNRFIGSTAADVVPAKAGTLPGSSSVGESGSWTAGTWTGGVWDPVTGSFTPFVYVPGAFTADPNVAAVNWEPASGVVVRCDGPSKYTYNPINNNYVVDYFQITLTPTANGNFSYKADKWQTINYMDGSGSDTSLLAQVPYMTGTVASSSNAVGTSQNASITGDFPSLINGAYKETVAINFAFAATATTERSDFSGTIASYNQANNLLSSIGLATGSYLTADILGSGLMQTTKPSALHLVIDASVTDTKFTGTFDASAFATDASGFNVSPTMATFTGTISDTSAGGVGVFLTGKIDSKIADYNLFNSIQPTSSTNYQKQTGTFTGTVAFPNQSPLTLVMSSAQTGVNTQSNSINLTYATGKVISGSWTTTNGAGGAIALTDTSGVNVTIPNTVGAATDIKVGNEIVGSVNNGVISYTDLTVESLN